MTVEHIAHMDWTVSTLASGERMYTNTTEGITGVAIIGEPGKFSYVVVAEDGKDVHRMYNNAEFSDWNIPRTWGILENLAEAMYDVEQELIEDSYDSLYEIGEDYDDYEGPDYGMENDSDLYNEW